MLSAVDALDTAYLLSKIGGEMVGSAPLQIDYYTDSKSMFDAVHTTNLLLDKRMRVDVASLRELSENNEVTFYWIESKFQLADALTKRGASKIKLLEAIRNLKLKFRNTDE